jgi:NlpB/DapX lipoprotein
MKQALLIFGCAALILITGGCVTDNGTLPTPSANFTPKRTYAIPHDKLWQTVLDTLDKNRITTVSMDKSSGIIATDYVAGPGRLVLGGLGGAQSTRYKYNISLRDESDGSVKMNILCKVESSIYSGEGSSQWRDVTPSNAPLADKLESWLYEQIEDGLKTP